MKLEQFDTAKAKSIVIIVVVIIVIVVLVAFGKNIKDFINQLFGAPTKEELDAQKQVVDYNYQSSNPNSPFSPKVYANRPSSTSVIDSDTAGSIISDIYSSVGAFGLSFLTDAKQGYAAIQKCNTQCDVSYCVTLFTDRFHSDMYDYMAKYYNSGTDLIVMNQILQFVKNLPVY